jgi:ketol-acid reductoisomerase
MRQALKNIQTGEYAKKFIMEGMTNYPEMTAKRRLTRNTPFLARNPLLLRFQSPS